MKYYVAAHQKDKATARKVQKMLIAGGHEITADWTELAEEGDNEFLRDVVLECEEGVRGCDYLVLLMWKNFPYRGAWVELGIAIALKKQIFLIGEYGLKCDFAHHPLV
ncbi:unnamed protein product, partial [marine sediment metagenome]